MISDRVIENVLIAAFEGGSNYWIESVNKIGVMLGDFHSDHVAKGGEVTLNIHEDKPETLTKAKIVKGIKRAASDMGMSDRAWYENHDADAADCALQFAVFDQIVYG